jgi:hypothetical protein
MAKYGIGATPQGRTSGVAAGNAIPVYPSNGAGGPGILGGAVNLGAAQSELSDLTAGRITLAMVEVAFVGLIAFYLWTRSSQGG